MKFLEFYIDLGLGKYVLEKGKIKICHGKHHHKVTTQIQNSIKWEKIFNLVYKLF